MEILHYSHWKWVSGWHMEKDTASVFFFQLSNSSFIICQLSPPSPMDYRKRKLDAFFIKFLPWQKSSRKLGAGLLPPKVLLLKSLSESLTSYILFFINFLTNNTCVSSHYLGHPTIYVFSTWSMCNCDLNINGHALIMIIGIQRRGKFSSYLPG